MKAIRFGLGFTILLLIGHGLAYAQVQDEKAAVVFDELYDEPYAINKLFIGFQPFYGELFATNVAQVHHEFSVNPRITRPRIVSHIKTAYRVL